MDTRMTTIPAELDILPPRPVLFPWLPSSMGCFLDLDLTSCCFGAEEIATKNDLSPMYEAPAIRSVLSFDDGEDDDGEDYEFCDAVEIEKTIAQKPPSPEGSRFSLKPLFGPEKAAAGHGTTTILVLSREDNDDDEEIPDMSDAMSDAGSESSRDDVPREENYPKPRKTFYPAGGAKLVSLADVVEQILRVLMFIMSATSMKPKMLRSGNYQPQPVRSQ